MARGNRTGFGEWTAFGGILTVSVLSLVTSHWGEAIHWELLSHFKAQYFSLALLVLVGLALGQHTRLAVASIACIAFAFLPLLAFYFPNDSLARSPDESNFSLLSANVHQNRSDPAQLASVIAQANPDAVVLQEASPSWLERLSAIRNAFPFDYHRAGTILLSKTPIDEGKLKPLNSARGFVLPEFFTTEGKAVALVAAHPLPPISQRNFRARNEAYSRIEEAVNRLSGSVVLVGDLNTTMWSPYYQKLVDGTGLINTRKGFGILPTWPTANNPLGLPGFAARLLSIPIDHCLVTPELQVVQTRALSSVGSDHRPIAVDLVVPHR